MKQLLLIAALALGISVTGASAQRAVNIADLTGPATANSLNESLIQVHKKHRKFGKYKRYSHKLHRKHNRNSHYAYKYRHKHHRHYSHRHDQYYGPAYGLYGSIILGNGAVIIRLY